MTHSANVIHHQQRRTRKSPVDRLIFLAAIISPFGTIPQLVEVYTTRDVEGLSPLTWFFYTIFPCIWIWYGLVHKDKAILINNILWFFVSGSVFVGVLLYR